MAGTERLSRPGSGAGLRAPRPRRLRHPAQPHRPPRVGTAAAPRARAAAGEESRRGVPLVATLAAYLENGQRPSAAATALAVHVNTLYQRLAVIDRVLGPAWRERALELQALLRVGAAAEFVD